MGYSFTAARATMHENNSFMHAQPNEIFREPTRNSLRSDVVFHSSGEHRWQSNATCESPRWRASASKLELWAGDSGTVNRSSNHQQVKPRDLDPPSATIDMSCKQWERYHLDRSWNHAWTLHCVIHLLRTTTWINLLLWTMTDHMLEVTDSQEFGTCFHSTTIFVYCIAVVVCCQLSWPVLLEGAAGKERML